jgi:endogenous inhibitor of DNA gyrase (YacG/DUF329 family)
MAIKRTIHEICPTCGETLAKLSDGYVSWPYCSCSRQGPVPCPPRRSKESEVIFVPAPTTPMPEVTHMPCPKCGADGTRTRLGKVLDCQWECGSTNYEDEGGFKQSDRCKLVIAENDLAIAKDQLTLATSRVKVLEEAFTKIKTILDDTDPDYGYGAKLTGIRLAILEGGAQ